jgi:hypothetical protein
VRPELLAILERVRMSRLVPAAAPGAGTPETASERRVPDVPAVPAEIRQGESLHCLCHKEDGQQDVEQVRLAYMEPACFPVGVTQTDASARLPVSGPVTPVTAVQPHNDAVFSVTAADPGAVTGRDTAELAKPADPVPAAPRYRAWQMRKPDGSRAGVVLDPGGMTEAEAMAALPRPGWSVTPLAASVCTSPDDRKLP